MSDDRTDEQRQADQQLHEAIERVVRAYQVVPTTCVVTNWVVLGTGLGIDGEGDLHQTFTLLPNDGSGLSPDTLIGILRGAVLRAEYEYLHGSEDPAG